MKADGSVIINTKINNDGMERGFEAIKNEMNSVSMTAKEVGDALQRAFSGNITPAIENAVAKVQKLEEKLAVATEGFYSAVYGDNDKEAEKWATKRESAYNQLESARRRLTQVIVREADKEAAAEARATRKAAEEKERQYKRATKSARAFGKRLTGIVASALVFNVISKGLRSVTRYFGKALKTNQKFNETASDLKGALLTAFQPLYETILPGIISGMRVLTKYALFIGDFFSSIAGKNSQQMKENAEALYDQANATEENAEAAKKAEKALAGFDEINALQSKDAEGTIPDSTYNPNFDLEAIDLDSKLADLVRFGSEALFAVGLILLLSGANFSLGLGMTVAGAIGIYESIQENWGGVKDNIITTSEAIAFLGNTLLFAIGVILVYCCPSHLALGIGLIVAGASGMAAEVATNWNAIKEVLQSPLGATGVLLTGAVLVVLGIFCCLAQIWGLGIGLIVAGAAAIVATIAVNWNAIKEWLQSPLGAAVALFAGAVLLVIGIFCCIAQNWILGISLIVAGAAFIITTVALNWNAIKEALQGPIGAVVAVVSAALLVIGAIIAFSGAGLVLGVSLMAAGAVGLVTTVALNWNAIVDAMQGPIGKMVAIVSGALLVLGVILLCCGIVTPLTIGMVVAGAAGLATTIAFNWSSIVDWVKNAWNKVKEFWNNHIAQVFTGKFWTDLAKKCGNGLISGFEGAVNGIISLFETMINWVVKGINSIGFDVPNWLQKKLGFERFGFNIPEVKFSRLSIPRLAQGAVIPPNREFMAVLGDQRRGTNIEAPLETIKQALAEVMAMQDGKGETVVNVNFSGDLAQLARLLKPAIDTETRRRGGSLAKGTVI